MKVSSYICEYLISIGVKVVMGYSGGAIAHLIDSVYLTDGLSFLHFNHEQGAALGAAALGKHTGKLQVVCATSGPGATNLITGIAEAYFDSVPLLIITGQVNTYDSSEGTKVRQRGFQETDIVSLVKPITKYATKVDSPKDIPAEFKKACEIALSGRKGPVVIDVPMDVQRSEVDSDPDGKLSLEISANFTDNDIEEVLSMIREAKQPLILSGGGVSQSLSHDLLLDCAETCKLPVVVSLMGKDSFPHDHDLFVGFIGAYGNRVGNLLMVQSDLLIVLGSRLDTRQIGNVIDPFKLKKIIWVDIEPHEIEAARLMVSKSIISDVSIFLAKLKTKIRNEDRQEREKYFSVINELKNKYSPLKEIKRCKKEHWHYDMFNKISQHMTSESVACIDVGQIQMLSAQILQMKKGSRFINSGGLAPMGYALPAAAAISMCEKRPCVAVVGDGGYQINIQELNIIANNNLPVIIICLNNKSLGMIKQFQELYFEKRYSGTDVSSGYYICNFQAVTRAYGIDSYKIDRYTTNIDEIFDKVFSLNKPVFLELDADYDTYVYPKLSFDKPIDKIAPLLTEEEEIEIETLFSQIT